MEVRFGAGKTKHGPGVDIELSGAEVAAGTGAFLVAHGIHVSGPRTVTVSGEPCKIGKVYVDPCGQAIADGICWPGGGPTTST